MDNEKSHLINSLIPPVVFVVIVWMVKITELTLNIDLVQFGLIPRSLQGLAGIITAPLLHADLKHLISNTAPLFILGTALFYFYKKIAWRITLLIYIMTGVWVWLAARDSIHIGASGIIYGFAVFLIFSGVLRKDNKLLAISMLVILFYGGLVWGIFPKFFPKENISWESHFMGSIAGLITSFFFKDKGPQRKKYSWELEPEKEEEIIGEKEIYLDAPPIETSEKSVDTIVNYEFKENPKTGI